MILRYSTKHAKFWLGVQFPLNWFNWNFEFQSLEWLYNKQSLKLVFEKFDHAHLKIIFDETASSENA